MTPAIYKTDKARVMHVLIFVTCMTKLCEFCRHFRRLSVKTVSSMSPLTS